MKMIFKKIWTLKLTLTLGVLALWGVACSNTGGSAATEALFVEETPQAEEAPPPLAEERVGPAVTSRTCYKFAFVSDRNLGAQNVWVADTCSAEEPRPLTTNTIPSIHFDQLSFLPDGTRLSFHRFDENDPLGSSLSLLSGLPPPNQLSVFQQIDAGDLGALAGDFLPASLAFEPNGNRVAFVARTVQSSGGGPITVLSSLKLFDPSSGLRDIMVGDNSRTRFSGPIWHLPSQSLIFSRSGAFADFFIQRHNLATGTTNQILEGQANSISGSPLSGGNPTISPDGQTLVFSRRVGSFSQIHACTFVPQTSPFNTDFCQNTRTLTLLGNNLNPAFTPDGQFLFFISDRDGNREIYMMRPDGSEQRRLTQNFSEEGNLAVHPISFQAP